MLDDQGYQVLLDYRGGKAPFKKVSMKDVMVGTPDALRAALKGRAVIIGSDAASVPDFFTTPFNSEFTNVPPIAGIQIHGYLADQLIREALYGAPSLKILSHYGTEMIWISGWAIVGTMVGIALRRPVLALGVLLAGWGVLCVSCVRGIRRPSPAARYPGRDSPGPVRWCSVTVSAMRSKWGTRVSARWCSSSALRHRRGEAWVEQLELGPLVALAVVLAGLRVSQAQADNGRNEALDDIGRGTAAFRAGDIVAATQNWSEAIRVCRQIGAPDIEAQALSRRGEAYRIEGYFRDADRDLRAALAKADESGDQALIAASSGALGNLAFMSRRTALAEPLLKRSRDLASRLRDFEILAAADNDLGNLYAATGRPAEAASAYSEAIRNAEAAPDEALAATAEINAARLALGHGDAARAPPLLSHAIDRLEQSAPSYSRGLALISAGSTVFEPAGSDLARRPEDRSPRLSARGANGRHASQYYPVLARPWQSRSALRAHRPTRRGSTADRTGFVRGTAGLVSRSRISLGVAARSPRPHGRAQRGGNS